MQLQRTCPWPLPGRLLPLLAVWALAACCASAAIFPSGTGLRVELSNGQQHGAAEGSGLSVLVGEGISSLSIELPPGYGFSDRPSRVKAVEASVTSAEAEAGGCLVSAIDPSDVELPLSAELGVPTALLNGGLSLSTALDSPVRFRKAGLFRLCFSDDGSFAAGHADVVGVVLVVEGFVTSRLPAGTGLQFGLSQGLEVDAVEGQVLSLSAGESIQNISVMVPDGCTFNVSKARLRFIAAPATGTQANATVCAHVSASAVGPDVIDPPLYSPSGAPTEHGPSARRLLLSLAGPVAFREGGRFQVCYSDDGSFASEHIDIVRVVLDVQGATHACADDECMARQTFNCYSLLSKDSDLSNCSVTLDGLHGSPARASWSTRFSETYGGDGRPLHLAPGPCGGVPEPGLLCPWPERCSVGDLADTVIVATASQVLLPPAGALSTSEARAIAVCYCSGLRGCSDYGSYTQQVGIVYLFVAAATLPGDSMCSLAWSGVLAPVHFALCVRCPPGACEFQDEGSQVLMAQGARLPEQPSWSPGHGCRSATRVPDLLPASPDATAGGGPRSDYKRFSPTGAPGFSLPQWPDYQPAGTFLDICFCLGSCESSPSNWFKVGELAVVPPRLVAAAATGAPELRPPHEVRLRGQLALDRSFLAFGYSPEVLGLGPGGMARVATFSVDTDDGFGDACNRLPHEEAPGDLALDVASGAGLGERLLFGGLTLNVSGVYAVCYCPLLDNVTGLCADVPWAVIGALSLPGPRPGQTWTLPVFRIVRFEYLGTDLRTGDVLRFVAPEERCDANPTPQALELCPQAGTELGHEICATVGLPAVAEYETATLAHNRVACNEMNGACRRATLAALEPRPAGLRLHLGASSSSPGGLGDLGLADGDMVTLTGGVVCGENCTEDVLAQAQGVRLFAGLQMYVDFEEGLDTVLRRALIAKDRVGGRHFSLPPQVDWTDPGYRGASLLLGPGLAAQLHEGEPKELLDVTGAWSFLVWVRVENAGWHTLLGLANSSGVLERGELELGLAGAPWPVGAVFLQQPGVLEGNASQMGARVVASGAWTHVAVVYTGGVSRELHFYVGGALAYKRTEVTLERAVQPLVLGGGAVDDIVSGRQRAAGHLELDEVRWYNRAFSAADVAAVAAAADPTLDSAAVPGAVIGNRIVRAGTGADGLAFDVPGLAWRSSPTFGLGAGGGAWRRTSRGVTKAEIMTPNIQTVKVCWGRQGLFAEAGHIDFRPPARLREVGVYATSTEWDKPSPFIISFRTTGRTGSASRSYELAQGPLTLELVFLDRDRFDITSSTVDGFEMPFRAVTEDQLGEESQAICGKLFRELWSSDSEHGFPLPKGCYHRGPAPNMRQLVVIFEPRNGLVGGEEYQLVMNGKASNMFDVEREIVLIQTGDDINERRYSSIHIGHGFMNKAYQLGAGKVDPQFGPSAGLEVVEGDVATQLYEMSKPGRLSLRFRGGTSQLAGIRRGNFITLWFWPLTTWQLPNSCADVTDRSAFVDSLRLRCTVVVGTSRRCGVIDSCIGRSVVKNGNVNSLHIQLPGRMNDLFGTLVYQMQVSKFELPEKGILPHRIAGEVTKTDGSKPSYAISSGPLLYVPIDPRAVLGRLITNGDENVPFQGVPAHHLYIQLILPTTIRGEDFSQPEPLVREAAQFVVVAPEGFTVLDITAAAPEGLGIPVRTLTGEAVSGLNMSEPTPAPTGFGTPQLSGWRIDGRNSTYTPPSRSMIPAGTPVVVGFMVRPTNTSLPISDPANLWLVEVTSPGDHNMTLVRYSQGFYRTGVGGVPVLGELTDGLVQPSDAAVSADPAAPVVHWLSVFFRTGVNVTAGGSINVEGPTIFDFGEACNAEDLAESHYVRGLPRQVHRLPTILRCEGFCEIGCNHPLHLARVSFEGTLVTGRTYGFRVQVANPSPQAVALEAAAGGGSPWAWALRTRGPLGDAVGVSTEQIPAAPGVDTSWELRNTTLVAWPSLAKAIEEQEPGVALGLASALPFRVEQEATLATLLLMLPFDVYGELTIVAPDGFEWLKDMVEPQPGAPWNQTETFLDLPSEAQVFGRGGGNVLRFAAGGFRARARYGLRAPVYVPDFAPVASVPSFFVHVAPSNNSYGAGVGAEVPAEPVRSLVDAVARAAHRLPGTFTDMMLQVKLVTPIAYPGALFVKAPPGYEAASTCSLLPWPGQAAWSAGDPAFLARCAWQQDTGLRTGAVVRLSSDAAFVQRAFLASYVPGLAWREEMRQMLGGRFRVLQAEVGAVGLASPGGGGEVWRFPERAAVREPSGMLRVAPAAGVPLPAGLLRVRLAVRNPTESAAAAAATMQDPDVCGLHVCWIFESRDGQGLHLDAPLAIPGLDVALEMAEAEMLDAFQPAGRDDRPLQRNRLPFRFRLKAAVPGGSQERLPPGQLQLTGPVGFVFSDRCLPDVETRTTMIFGEGPNPLRRWDIEVWERSALVVACEGHGETAILTIAAGLYAHHGYAFTIAMRNAVETPVINNWTISFYEHFSRPFPSFDIWTFMNVTVAPLSVHAAARCHGGQCVGAAAGLAVPVMLFFRPYQTIRTDGHLRIDMPQDFNFPPTPGAALVEGQRPTPCILRERELANLTREAMRWPAKDRDCLIVDKGDPLDGSGTGDRRTLRLVPRYQFNEVDPTPPLVLAPDRIYELVLFVEPPSGFRPVQDWQLESRTAEGELLDIGKVPGYEVRPVLRGLQHTNLDGYNFYTNSIQTAVTGGLTFIPDLVFEFIFTENIWPADRIVLVAPPGFQMQRPSTLPGVPGSCITFHVVNPPAIAALIPAAPELARCDGEVLTFHLGNLQGPMYSPTPLRLLLELTNPNVPIPMERNYWLAEHRSGVGGGLVASALAGSWPVVPRLLRTAALAFGALKAAGAETTLYFSYRGVQAASETEIEALSPPGFDFEGADAEAYIAGRRTLPQVLIASGPRLRLVMLVGEYEAVHVTVDSVTLPLVHAPTAWRVTTFALSEEGEETLLRDRAELPGFLVSGRITVSRVTAITDGIPDAILGRDNTMLTMHLDSTSPLDVGDVFRVELEGAGDAGFGLYPLSAELRDPDGGLLATWLCAAAPAAGGNAPVGDQDADLGPDCMSGFSNGSTFFDASSAVYKRDVNGSLPTRMLPLIFNASVSAGQEFRFHLRVRTPPRRTEFLLERWNISVFRDANNSRTTLVSTNDALRLPLAVVTLLPREPRPWAPHRPPLAVVEVVLTLDPLDTGAAAFTITAPPGFGGFPRVCSDRLSNNVSAFRCRALDAPPLAPEAQLPPPGEGPGFQRARLDCGPGAGVECMRRTPVVVLVGMPRLDPPAEQNLWFVEAVEEAVPPPAGTEVAVGEMIGRRELQGFSLSPMPAAAVYSSSPSVPIDVAVSFVSRVSVPRLGTVHVSAPLSLESFRCGSVTRGEVQPLSPMSVLSCEDSGVADVLFVRLRFNATLPAGRHLIAVPATTARSTAQAGPNVFEVFLLDAEDRVLDVGLDIPGEPLLQGLRASAWPAFWRPAVGPSASQQVTLPIELINDADVPVYGILVALPPSMMLHPSTAGQVEVDMAHGEEGLPRQGGTMVGPGRNSFLMRLDGTRRLLRGTYLLRFDIMVPQEVPAFNLWRVAFCGEAMAADPESCVLGEYLREGRGSAVLSVFALAGYDPQAPQEGTPAVAGGARRGALAFHALAWLLLLLLAVRRGARL